jgi:NDP-sugar pyrophosphorylase family protein
VRAPIRKAFLLGAGLGTRLRPLTDALPKPLIPVLGAPLIRYAIDHCAAAGITEFAINTHHLPETWKDYFPGSREGSGESPCAPRIDFFHEPVLLETGGGIKNIEEWIAGEPILVYNGDILANPDLARLISTHRASGNLATLGVRSNGPALHLALDGRQVVDIHHKLGVAAGTHQFTGIYCIEPELLDSIPGLLPAG